MHDQGMCAQTGDNATIHAHSLTNEDQVYLFYHAMAQHVSNEDRNLRSIPLQGLLVRWQLDYKKHCWVLQALIVRYMTKWTR
jgi:hypothetical protein